MTVVALVQLQENLRRALRSIASSEAAVSFEETDEGQLLAVGEKRTLRPDVLVVGEKAREPIRLAQRMHALETDPTVLILSEADRLPMLRRAVQFAPLLGDDVTCLPSSDEAAVLNALRDAVTRTSLRQSYRTTVDALNARLAQSPAPSLRRDHLDRLLDRAPLAVVAVDSQDTIVSWNPRAALLFAIDERTAIGRSVGDVLNGPGGDRLRALLDACLSGHEPPPETVEQPVLTGTCEHVEVTATPIEGASGEVGALLLLQDVTARVQSEQRLAEVQAQLLAHEQAARQAVERERDQMRALEAQKDEFLSSIAHDLRTPLTGIRGWSQLLHRHAHASSLSPDRVREITERIGEGVNRVSRLIDELLDVANSQLGHPLPLQLAQVDLVQLLRTLAAGHGAAAPSHHIAVESAVDQLTGEWDGPRLERAFGNILSNAIKFSPEGGKVAIRVDQRGEWVEVQISDPGIGIPADDLPHIFERFQRGANASGSIYGTGIGLASAHQIVVRHGGSIRANSEVGQGSIFTVRLPFAPP